MLSNIVQNSNQLINSQYNDQNSLLCQLVKLKGRRRNFSLYEPAHKKGSIFQEPQFMPRMTFQSFRKGQRIYALSQPFKKRTKSEEASKNQEKTIIKRSQQFRKSEIQTLEPKNLSKENESKIIHSFKNTEWYGPSKTQKIHHERVFSRKDKFTKANEIIQEPGFMNLCFYRNTLEQIQTARTTKHTNRKRNSPKRSERDTSTRNKIRFVKYKDNKIFQNSQCRPWSPKNESDLMDSGEFPNFKQVFVKV